MWNSWILAKTNVSSLTGVSVFLVTVSTGDYQPNASVVVLVTAAGYRRRPRTIVLVNAAKCHIFLLNKFN